MKRTLVSIVASFFFATSQIVAQSGTVPNSFALCDAQVEGCLCVRNDVLPEITGAYEDLEVCEATKEQMEISIEKAEREKAFLGGEVGLVVGGVVIGFALGGLVSVLMSK